MFKSEIQLVNLIEMLQELRNYYGAPAEFIRRLNKKTNYTFPRKTFHDILNGKITFKREKWANILIIALETAKEVLSYYEQKHEIAKKKSIKPSSFFQFDNSIQFVENTLHLCDSLCNQGEAIVASQQMENLNNFIQIDKIIDTNLYLYGLFNLVFARIQMQVGVNSGLNSSLSFLEKSVSTFEKLKNEKELFIRSKNLEGHIYRQLGELKQLEQSLESFNHAKVITNSTKLKQIEKDKILMNLRHQEAFAFARIAEKTGNIQNIEQANKLITESNEFFKHTNEEKWYRFSRIREAEFLVQSGQLEKATRILDFYNTPSVMHLMTKMHLTVFHRVNTVIYLKNKDIKNALPHYKTAVLLSLQQKYTTIERLKMIYYKYDILRKNLPENFSVYSPKWS